MVSTYTPNKNLNKPARGDLPGTWDTPVNSDWDYIDEAFGGYILFAASSGSRTLTSGVSDPYSYIPLTIEIGGTQSINLTYTIPSGVGGQWLILNNATDSTGGPYTTTFKTSAGGSVGVVVTKGVNTIIYSNGTEIYDVKSSATPTTNYQYDNKFINGNMLVDQRNTATTPISASGVSYTVDRWWMQSTAASKMSVGQNLNSITPPTGFSKYLGIQSLTSYSLTSTDIFGVGQIVEGFNISDLSWGTATAKTVTLSFVVRSSTTGTFGGAVVNGSSSYSYPFSYSIPTANAWTNISVTIPGPTAGVWPTNNTGGLYMFLAVGVGSTYSGTAGAWVGGSIFSATGAVSIVSSSGATFYVTGVQLEIGTSANPYQTQNYGTQLAQCQRYYYKGYILNGFGFDQTLTPGGIAGLLQTPVPMRTVPTATGNVANAGKLSFIDTSATSYTQSTGGWSITSSSAQAASSQYQSFTWLATTFSGITSFRPYIQAEYTGMPVDAPAILDAEIF